MKLIKYSFLIFTFFILQSCKEYTHSFNECIKNRTLIFRFPFNGEYYESLMFYPITETKGNVYLVSFKNDMNRFSELWTYRFSYSISNDEIFMTNGKSITTDYKNRYKYYEDIVLKIKKNSSEKIVLQIMPDGLDLENYFWKYNIDEFYDKKLY